MTSGDDQAPAPAKTCEDLWSLLQFFKAHTARIADKHGLTPIQFGALRTIADQAEKGATMGRIARKLHCDASNATGIVDRLTALQLVIRQDNPEDRRVKLLVLTPRGKTVLSKALKELPEVLGCARLDDRERETLHRLVVKLTSVANGY